MGTARAEAKHHLMARPTKLTDKVEKEIIDAVREGSYLEIAAQAAGISARTLYHWKARGEEGGVSNARYVQFSQALSRAEAQAERAAITAVRRAWNEDWRSAFDYLARRHPERWGKVARLEMSGRDGGAIQIETEDLSRLSAEELREYRRLRAKTG